MNFFEFKFDWGTQVVAVTTPEHVYCGIVVSDFGKIFSIEPYSHGYQYATDNMSPISEIEFMQVYNKAVFFFHHMLPFSMSSPTETQLSKLDYTNFEAKVLRAIKELRINKGVRQADISKYLGMAQNNYGKLENGKMSLTVDRMLRIAEYFGVSETYFLAAARALS